ncbi:MAG: ATP-binding protein [Bacteroidota bacterium]
MLRDSSSQKAIETWKSLIQISEKSNYYRGAGFCYYQLGILHISDAQYFKSYTAYEKSKSNYEISNDKIGLARTHNALAILFKNLNKFEQSLNHFLTSANLFKELKMEREVGLIYSNLGGMFEERASFQKAKLYLNQSEQILKKLGDPGLISCYINLGEVFEKEQKFDSAYFYFNKSYELSKTTGDIEDKFQVSYHFGKHLFFQNQIDTAEPLLNNALSIFNEEENRNILSLDRKALFTDFMSKFAVHKGDTSRAYLFLRKSLEYEIEYKKLISNRELESREVERLQLENELAKKETELQRKRKTLILYASILGLLISFLLIVVIYRSYRHKQKANQLLQEMDELKTKLYSNITHELRTPLTLILGPLEQMLSKKSNKVPGRNQVKMMRKNAQSLLQLVNEMLDLAKIDAKSLKLEIREVDVAKLVRTCFAYFASMAEQKNIDYEIRGCSKKFVSYTDPSKLEKIITNLVSNAVKFTPKNGKIRCITEFHQNNSHALKITVKDTGKGIPANELDKIFDRFHQVKNEKADTNAGTGIGLSLTNELVNLMHGKIEVSSTPGKGSTFKVTIPLGTNHLKQDEFILIDKKVTEREPAVHPADDSTTDEYPKTEIIKHDEKNLPQVLIAEDQIEIREYIEENLYENYSVKQAENGVIAFELAAEFIPDLIVTDLMMPEMDGIELCKKIKTDERTSHIPVIMLTGKSRLKDRLKGLETGADAYLTKPFSMKELKLRISKLIEQRQKLRELFTRNLNLEPKEIAVTSADEKFLTRALEIIEKNMGNSDFEIRQFQEELLMSRMQLFRKIKALTNQTPGEFIRTIRLKRAASLLKQNFGNVAQIAYEVGFNNPSYFAKCFHDLYRVLPSQYQENPG